MGATFNTPQPGNGGSEGDSAYLAKCKLAPLAPVRAVVDLDQSEYRVTAANGDDEAPPPIPPAKSSVLPKALIGVAVGVCLVAAVWAWRDDAGPPIQIEEATADITDVAIEARPTDLQERRLSALQADAVELPAADPPPPVVDRIPPSPPTVEAVDPPPLPAVGAVPATREVQPEDTSTAALIKPDDAPREAVKAAPADWTSEVVATEQSSERDGPGAVLLEAQQLFNAGRVEAARRLFQDLADSGNAEAAFALGTTYDPKTLAQQGLTNIAPDQEKALAWYRRAHRLAAAAAMPTNDGAGE